ncbi:ankyrin repeat and protein kinase domain-containing protein 1-like [Uloborus diversus]|uniref:ankyrin repeat and protein kinase domain-containing protein 1-like n=1 Tax=Uloborus diversus TaxID=327109 RepID=UPI00240A06D3|nr:ankyrin repeat and protein kinase domain-containing protein 1-like [Uloborus diversus]
MDKAALREQLANMALENETLRSALPKGAFSEAGCKLLVTCAGFSHASGNSGQETVDRVCPFEKCWKSMSCFEIWGLLPAHEASDTSEEDQTARTALHRAAAAGDPERVRQLLEGGGDTRALDWNGWTPLHMALICGKETAAEVLAEADCITDIRDDEECTPLHYAAQEGCVGVIRKLLDAGADTRLQNIRGMTPLHCALDEEREDAAELLADADSRNDVPDEEGCTPLHHAAMKGCVGIARKLIAGGADTRLRDKGGRTPLHHALAMWREDAAELLADADGENDVPEEDGRTPLLLAAQSGYVGVVKRLLWCGAHPHPKDEWGRSPLLSALDGGHDVVMRVIIAMCALRDVATDWEALRLSACETWCCSRLLSRCEAEIRRMKDARMEGSRASFWDVARRHVSEVSRYLESEAAREVLRSDSLAMTDFPIYRDLVAFRVVRAERWGALAPRWLECFFRVAQELPPTCTDLVLLHLSERDLRNFVRAVEFHPPEVSRIGKESDCETSALNLFDI